IQNFLEQNKEIDHLKFVPKEAALNTFREQMITYAPDLLRDPDILGLIPMSFQFGISSEIPPEEHLQKTESIASKLRHLAGVDEVSFGQDWVKNYAAIASGVSTFGTLLSLIIMTTV